MLTAGPALADRPHNLNLAQQQYFLEMTLKVVLPGFKQIGKPFVLVFWSRDPDGTQHNQGDRGINGPTSMTAIRTADGALAAIEQQLKALGLFETTNIIVAADHGFSTVSKESESGSRELPPGFLAVDLQAALQKEDSNLKLYDPDEDNKIIDPANAHPGRGDGLIGDGCPHLLRCCGCPRAYRWPRGEATLDFRPSCDMRRPFCSWRA
jgi:hypothetical protein